MANAAKATCTVVIDENALKRAISYGDGIESALKEAVNKIESRANAMAVGYETPIWHDHKTGETKGGTQAEYRGDVQLGKKGYVGIVYTANYAAQKENHQHNTLLKAKG